MHSVHHWISLNIRVLPAHAAFPLRSSSFSHLTNQGISKNGCYPVERMWQKIQLKKLTRYHPIPSDTDSTISTLQQDALPQTLDLAWALLLQLLSLRFAFGQAHSQLRQHCRSTPKRCGATGSCAVCHIGLLKICQTSWNTKTNCANSNKLIKYRADPSSTDWPSEPYVQRRPIPLLSRYVQISQAWCFSQHIIHLILRSQCFVDCQSIQPLQLSGRWGHQVGGSITVPSWHRNCCKWGHPCQAIHAKFS